MQQSIKRTVRHASSLPHKPHRSALIDALRVASAYSHPVDRIEVVETHISWVLLTGEFVYKIKKPVELGFLDFRELEQRHFFCEEEIRLNRFWALSIYLDVVAIVMQAGRPLVGGAGEPVEYAVRMRQFDPSQRLDRQLEAGRLTADDMLELAEELAARHQEAAPVRAREELLAVTKQLMWDNFVDLEGEVASDLLGELHRWTRQTLSDRDGALQQRCDEGFFRECHGDLHLANIVRLPQGIVAFDCIEFNADLRDIDVVGDYAFLVMDLVARGRTELAFGFLNRYLEVTGDYEGVPLLPLYLVYRSLVRAKVAAISRRERDAGGDSAADTETIDHYCELARTFVARRRPVLLLMTGLSGSGKTWISSRLLAALPALRLRSDIERKRLFDLGETADSQSGVGSGIYDRAAGDAVYRRLFEGARSMLAAGFDVILDAAFLAAAEREQARRVAEGCGAGFAIVEATAPVGLLRQRLRQRAAAGKDASEADFSVLQHQLDTREPLDPDERAVAVVVNTDAEVEVAALVTAVRQAAA